MTTVYPLVFKLGPLEITGYGIMMMAGFMLGGWLIDLELKRRGLRTEYAADITVAAVIGGVLGAKIWYVVLTQDLSSLFSRGGLVWYGGFIGGVTAVWINGLRRKVPTRWTAQLAAPALAAAYAIGRVGCFMVGDDYGRPTSGPLGVQFPQGLPPSTAGNMTTLFHLPVGPGTDPSTVLAVHPTQLYEVGLMFLAFMALWRLRRSSGGTGWLFGLYLVFAGTERFAVEFLRAKDDRFLGAFTVAQLASVVLVVVGTIVVLRLKGQAEISPGAYLSQSN